MLRNFILLKSELPAVTSTIATNIQKHNYSDTGGKDDAKKPCGSTLPVSECTSKDFDPPLAICRPKEPYCKSTPLDPLPVMPGECKTTIDKGPVYDEKCDRGYVNPCKPQMIPPCMPVSSMVNCRFQTCGQTNLMDSMPQPNDPRLMIDPKEANKARLYFLLSLLLASGVVYKLWDMGLLVEKVEPPRKKVAKRKSRRPQIIIKKPSTSGEIPDNVPYLLIGGGAATFSAFRAITTADPMAKVLVITDEPYVPYMRPPLSKEMFFNADRSSVQNLEFKQTNGMSRSIFFEDESYYITCGGFNESESGGVAVAQGWSVKKLEVTKRTAILEDGKEIKYDKCLLAVGSKPKNIIAFQDLTPEVDERVTLYRGIFDFEELDEIISQGARSIAIVGGGFLGSELACSLAKRGRDVGLKVTQIFPEKYNLSKVLPEYLCRWTKKMVENEGVQVLPELKVEDVYLENSLLQIQLSNGKIVEADQAVVAVGAAPNTQLAAASSLEVDEALGGFVANAELEARTGLYVAGDCACFFDEIYGRRRIEHHDNAVVSGRLAGENMVKGVGEPYSEQSMFWSDLGPNISFEAIGIVDPSLPTVGIYTKVEQEEEVSNMMAPGATGDGSSKQQSTEESPIVSESNAVTLEDLELTPDEECDEEEEVLAVEEECDEEEEVHAGTAGPPMEAETVVEEEVVNEDREHDEPKEKFSKGVVFYLKDDIVVGIVLWNIFNKIKIAKEVLKQKRKYDDLNELAKLFQLH